jgi:hypothetical protein
MTEFKLGSTGKEVTKIQRRLKALGLYSGTLDESFGGGTEGGVKAFQRQEGLPETGVVDEATFKRLFGEDEELPARPSIATKSLQTRCLALTGTFETSTPVPGCFSCVTGDFDGQGISFGALQLNFGQGSLQPLLQQMLDRHRDVMEFAFHSNLPTLERALAGGKAAVMSFARGIQDPIRKRVEEPWLGMFKTLGRSDECQDLQTEKAEALHQEARRLARKFELTSERAVALMFDIKVQNGSISDGVAARIRTSYRALPGDLSDEAREVERMRIVANRRSEAAKQRFVEDVRKRKLCIANGRGVVHGIELDLEQQFGISLAPA